MLIWYTISESVKVYLKQVAIGLHYGRNCRILSQGTCLCNIVQRHFSIFSNTLRLLKMELLNSMKSAKQLSIKVTYTKIFICYEATT